MQQSTPNQWFFNYKYLIKLIVCVHVVIRQIRVVTIKYSIADTDRDRQVSLSLSFRSSLD